MKKQDFLAFYVKDNKIQAVAGMNRGSELASFEEMFGLNKMPLLAKINEVMEKEN